MKDGVRKRLRWLRLHEELGDAGRVCLRCGISRPTLRKWLRWYEVGPGFMPKELRAHECSKIRLMKQYKKGHTSGCTVSFLHFSRHIVLLLRRPRLACKADLWACDRFLQRSQSYLSWCRLLNERGVAKTMAAFVRERETGAVFWQTVTRPLVGKEPLRGVAAGSNLSAQLRRPC